MIRLYLGGARSGKSRHALEAATAGEAPHIFVATAQPFDAEMEERIVRHRQERGAEWQTIEAPLGLAPVLTQAQSGTILVDCCTLWLSNLMLAEHKVEAEVDTLVAALTCCPANVHLVSNEVGSGIVPNHPLGRRFRDEQGRLNQRLAGLADRVDLIIAGLPLKLKG
ncbi:bifunctional adenosylcobinamide kinase/adenosylcobinamide-phosphate guanylyltransferase [Pacificimonas flava]|uniref:Bifunctional adenosylcobalamin biosynthesis protein n=1 Tax=Pacificimonas flava TaxID=1234595 RepID=M2U4A1_9SPHN|nr:bifunctional adenosylcobinamide kinase/adenosylcobinamide-phosphate guanylyltransferase [Pacificimonas flava]EMD82842.1 Adenosylcobinamide-phosphate guanylyltransferase [Pacificimonas flava]MBB5279457.1 adenosylcobinamide kinase/adenosylcobinamide-phosphate guanylyltransferase [Pacificimonas flava]